MGDDIPLREWITEKFKGVNESLDRLSDRLKTVEERLIESDRQGDSCKASTEARLKSLEDKPQKFKANLMWWVALAAAFFGGGFLPKLIDALFKIKP